MQVQSCTALVWTQRGAEIYCSPLSSQTLPRIGFFSEVMRADLSPAQPLCRSLWENILALYYPQKVDRDVAHLLRLDEMHSKAVWVNKCKGENTTNSSNTEDVQFYTCIKYMYMCACIKMQRMWGQHVFDICIWQTSFHRLSKYLGVNLL